MDAPLRRSVRSTRRTSKFTDDAFEGLDLDLSSNSEARAPSPRPHRDLVSQQDGEPSEEDAEISSDGTANEDDDLDDETSDLDTLLPIHEDTVPSRLGPGRRPRLRRVRPLQADEATHSRGVVVKGLKHYGEDEVLFSFGGKRDDCEPLVRTTNKWLNETTMPSRTANEQGQGGMSASFYATSGGGEVDSDSAEGVSSQRRRLESVNALQESSVLQEDGIRQRFLPAPKANELLAGSPPHLQRLSVKSGNSLLLSDLWPSAEPTANVTGAKTVPMNESCGWLLNLGESVHCLDWCPSHRGKEQFLALATMPTPNLDAMKQGHSQEEGGGPSAFTPSAPTPSAVQIWSFMSTSRSEGGATFDSSISPRRALVLCTEYGDAKNLKWCPDVAASQSTPTLIGLLATIHKDGAIRIFSIHKDADTDFAQFVKVTRVAFASRPPETICTSLAWLSSSVVAASCANGYVAVWDIDDHLNSSPPPENAVPCFYQPLHSTYITHIVSCHPSRPRLIATTCMDGTIQLTSLRDPESENVLSTRFRFGYPAVIWQDHTQHFVAADDSYNLRGLNVRSFFQSPVLLKQDAGIQALAGSPLHTSVLVGGSDGCVTVTNPVRRIVKPRKRETTYRQVWFKHEWRRGRLVKSAANGAVSAHVQNRGSNQGQGKTLPPGVDNASTTTDGGGGGEGSALDDSAPHEDRMDVDFPSGLTRLTTSFPVEDVTDSFGPSGRPTTSPEGRPVGKRAKTAQGTPRRKHATARSAAPGVIFTTIHERETAVRSLAWNPNAHVGGWAAAGMGSGLLVVQDLCWDR